jgi:hypothetical protein
LFSFFARIGEHVLLCRLPFDGEIVRKLAFFTSFALSLFEIDASCRLVSRIVSGRIQDSLWVCSKGDFLWCLYRFEKFCKFILARFFCLLLVLLGLFPVFRFFLLVLALGVRCELLPWYLCFGADSCCSLLLLNLLHKLLHLFRLVFLPRQ